MMDDEKADESNCRFCAAVLMTVSATACGSSKDSSGSGGSASKGSYFDKGTSSEDIIKAASAAGKIGNWGIGNEYELLALLTKYDLPNEFVSQAFDMDSFDDDSLMLASAMTYNELGLVKNDYDGGYGYGDTVGTIDMNDEGVAMLEDNIFCTQAFAEENPNTVAAFISASMKGWEYACENPDEAGRDRVQLWLVCFAGASEVYGKRSGKAGHHRYVRQCSRTG